MQQQRPAGGDGGQEDIGRIGLGGWLPRRYWSEREYQKKDEREPTAEHLGHGSGLYGANAFLAEGLNGYNYCRGRYVDYQHDEDDGPAASRTGEDPVGVRLELGRRALLFPLLRV
jgi:hypothetical protein